MSFIQCYQSIALFKAVFIKFLLKIPNITNELRGVVMRTKKILSLLSLAFLLIQCGDRTEYTDAQRAEIIQEQSDIEIDLED